MLKNFHEKISVTKQILTDETCNWFFIKDQKILIVCFKYSYCEDQTEFCINHVL